MKGKVLLRLGDKMIIKYAPLVERLFFIGLLSLTLAVAFSVRDFEIYPKEKMLLNLIVIVLIIVNFMNLILLVKVGMKMRWKWPSMSAMIYEEDRNKFLRQDAKVKSKRLKGRLFILGLSLLFLPLVDQRDKRVVVITIFILSASLIFQKYEEWKFK